MEYVNLFALAGIRTKAELAAWAPATGALVDYLASIDAEEGVLSMKAQKAIVKSAVDRAAAEAHVERVTETPAAAADKAEDREPKPGAGSPGAASKPEEGMAEQSQP